ncbi:DNL-type zinc finger protein [Senna tora]|uniref:DNL-type zinc finger protein n=1 Tax=Senna tora TaxID=362788 RepID=A0A834W9J1_9FABA|nr:DNL-type zinc finger protein [Senna tora]
MASRTVYSLPTALPSLSFSTDKNRCCNFFKPISIYEINPPSIRVYNYSSKFSRAEAVVSHRVFKVRGLVDDDSATGPEPESDNSEAGSTIDLRLPRRRCLQHHKLVDNLGLITEYDFREKTNMDSESDQV